MLTAITAVIVAMVAVWGLRKLGFDITLEYIDCIMLFGEFKHVFFLCIQRFK